MMPITDFLSCTHVFDELESLSPEQRHDAKNYATGLVAGRNKTCGGHRTPSPTSQEQTRSQQVPH
jgi:hypothetical protein